MRIAWPAHIVETRRQVRLPAFFPIVPDETFGSSLSFMRVATMSAFSGFIVAGCQAERSLHLYHAYRIGRSDFSESTKLFERPITLNQTKLATRTDWMHPCFFSFNERGISNLGMVQKAIITAVRTVNRFQLGNL